MTAVDAGLPPTGPWTITFPLYEIHGLGVFLRLHLAEPDPQDGDYTAHLGIVHATHGRETYTCEIFRAHANTRLGALDCAYRELVRMKMAVHSGSEQLRRILVQATAQATRVSPTSSGRTRKHRGDDGGTDADG